MVLFVPLNSNLWASLSSSQHMRERQAVAQQPLTPPLAQKQRRSPRTAPGCITYIAVFGTQQRQAVSGQGHDHVALLSRPVNDHLIVGIVEADLQCQGKGHSEPQPHLQG